MVKLLILQRTSIVGYMSSDMAGKVYNCVSFGFSSVSKDGVFQLKDINADAFSETSDTLQLLEPTLARTVKTYFFYDGQWLEDPTAWNDANEDTFDMATGFLGNFASKTVKLTAAGAVLSGPTALDFTGKCYNMVGNPLPRAVKFKEIEAVSFSETSDTLQKLESTLGRTIKTYFNYNGDWYEDTSAWNDASEDEIAAGEALLGNFAAKDVKLTFPGAL